MIATIESDIDFVTPPVDLKMRIVLFSNILLNERKKNSYQGSKSPLLNRMLEDDVMFLPPYIKGAIVALGLTFHFFRHLSLYFSRFQG